MNPPHSRKTFRLRLEHMVGALRGEIMTGKRLPGEFLPSERELVSQFQLSNKLVRVGLEQLVSEGLIVKIPRVGNRVADTAGERKVTVRFGYHSSLEREADIGRLLEAFHKAHPSIHVHPIPISFRNYDETVKEYMESGMLDAVTMNFTNFDQCNAGRAIELLQEQPAVPGVYPLLEQAFLQDDRLLVRPLLFSPLILCYHPEHFREQGLPLPFEPEHWDDLMHTASRLSVDNERFGFYSFLLSKNRWPVFLLQNGVRLPEDRRHIEDSIEGIIEGLSFCREMIYASNTFPTYLSGSDADAEELFAQGKVSVIMTSYFALNALQGSGIPFDIAPLPGLKERTTLVMAIGIAVNRRSTVQIAAQALSDFLISEEAQLLIRRNTVSIPALRSAAEWTGEESLYRPPHFSAFREVLPFCRWFTDVGMTSGELDLVMKEARLFWARLQTKETMRERMQEILSSK